MEVDYTVNPNQVKDNATEEIVAKTKPSADFIIVEKVWYSLYLFFDLVFSSLN